MLLLFLFSLPSCNAWIWTAEDFDFYCRDTNAEINFGSDFSSYPVDVTGNAWTFYDVVMEDGEPLDYLTFSGLECNVTLTELNNKKLYVATVADATESSQVSLNSSYNLPYVAEFTGAITALEVSFIENNQLRWSASGTGPVSYQIISTDNPLYLKINNVVKIQGDSWHKTGNLIIVNDILGSTHDYELSWTGLPSSPEPRNIPDDDVLDDFVENVIVPGPSFVEENFVILAIFAAIGVIVIVGTAGIVKIRDGK